jgi:uncharacterized protein (DUF362 family)
MGINRRQFLKNSGISLTALAGAASMLRPNSAFAAFPCAATSDVSFVGGTSSYVSPNNSKAGRRGMIYDVLLPFQTDITAGIAGKTVIIKPNLSYASGAGAQAVLNATHVDALRGLIDFLRMINPNLPIVIAEASAGSTAGMMNWCGYLNLLSEFTNITLVDLNSNMTVTSSGSTGVSSNFPATTRHIWKFDQTGTVPINATSAFLDKNNYVISITRPKTHDCMVITATVKNMCMGMPLTGSSSVQSGNSKSLMHSANSGGVTPGEDKVLAYNLYQSATQMVLCGIPNFAVLDAWEGQQHNGPVSGTSIMQYCAVAGPDFLAVDRLAAKLMGFSDTPVIHQVTPYNNPSYTDMRALVWMSNSRLGNYDMSRINFRSGTLASLTTFIKNYQLHDHYTATNGTTTSWETIWADSTNMACGPITVLDSLLGSGVVFHDPSKRPIMNPQANVHAGGIVTGSEVRIDIFLPSVYQVNLGIYDMQGREVRRFRNEYLNAGRYSIGWDCKDNHGASLSNGNYIIKMSFGRDQMSDKITLLR